MSSIDPVVSEEKMFENVDGRRTDGQTTDAGVIGILLAHQWAFGSGELIIVQWDGYFEHPKHMLKLMGKKIFTILRTKNLFI